VAATRVGGCATQWIAPGQDTAYLAGLPIDALPLSERTLGLLAALGLRTAGALQAMGAQALEARFGPEGRRAWQSACGHDPRRPLTPSPRATARLVLPLLEGCEGVEPLLFVLRPALEKLMAAQAHAGQAIACLALTLEHAWGPQHEVLLTPSRPITDPRLLQELVRLRLHEGLSGETDTGRGPVVTLALEARRATQQRPRQTDLFTTSVRTTHDAEAALVRLASRLSGDAIGTPTLHDEQRPEQAGGWRSLTTTVRHDHGDESDRRPGCLRLLPSPRALERLGARPERIALRGQVLHPTQWLGPERLSGHWWMSPYDRDYYWVSTREGWALWLFRDRPSGHWFLHGWLD